MHRDLEWKDGQRLPFMALAIWFPPTNSLKVQNQTEKGLLDNFCQRFSTTKNDQSMFD